MGIAAPASVNEPVEGSYSSGGPPTISTLPSPSKMAEWPARAVVMLPVGVKAPVEGCFERGKAPVSIAVGAFLPRCTPKGACHIG